MNLIEKEGVPAPAPIEQRWTASSSADMSPAHDGASPETVRVEFLSISCHLCRNVRRLDQVTCDRSNVYPRPVSCLLLAASFSLG